MHSNDRTGVEEDGRFEHVQAECERPNRDDIHTDTGILGMKTTDKELFAIKPIKAWTQHRRRIAKKTGESGMATLRYERDPLLRNKAWNRKSVGDCLAMVAPPHVEQTGAFAETEMPGQDNGVDWAVTTGAARADEDSTATVTDLAGADAVSEDQ